MSTTAKDTMTAETETTSTRPPPDWHTAEVKWSDDLELYTPLCVQANLSGPTAHKVKPAQIYAVISTHINSTDISNRVVGHYRYHDPRTWYLECTTQTMKSTLLSLRGVLIGGKDMLVFSEPGANLVTVNLGFIPLSISRNPVKLARFTEMLFPGVKCAKPANHGSLDEVKILIVDDGRPIRHFYNVTDALGKKHRIRATVPGRILACDRCYSADHKSKECTALPARPTPSCSKPTMSASTQTQRNQHTKDKSTWTNLQTHSDPLPVDTSTPQPVTRTTESTQIGQKHTLNFDNSDSSFEKMETPKKFFKSVKKTLDESSSDEDFFNNVAERITNPKNEDEKEQQQHFNAMKDELLKDFKVATDNPAHLQTRAKEMAEMPTEKRTVNFGVLAALIDRGGFFTENEQELVQNFLNSALKHMEDNDNGNP